LCDIEAPTFSQTIGSHTAVRLSALRAGRLLPNSPRKISGTHFCQRLSRPHGDNVATKIRLIEKSIDLIGTRTRDLPACSILPQTTTLSRVPFEEVRGRSFYVGATFFCFAPKFQHDYIRAVTASSSLRFSLYSLATDRVENTAPSSSSIVANILTRRCLAMVRLCYRAVSTQRTKFK
jgi:hypothetical protein